MTDPVRVYVLTGFLGSGKTTLLNALLRRPDTPPIAVVVNEYGAVGIDHLLLPESAGAPVLLENGCICCTVRSDLSHALQDLLIARRIGTLPPFDTIVVETTGLAEPGPVVDTVLNDPALQGHILLGGILTMVDAAAMPQTIANHPVSVAQIAAADRLLVSKADIADPALTIAAVRRLNPAAPIDVLGDDGIETALLFASGLYDPAQRRIDLDRWLGSSRYDRRPHATQRHGDASDIDQYCLRFDQPLRRAAIDLWIAALTRYRGERLLRVKAILAVEDHPDRPLVFHAVQNVFHPPVALAAWPDPDRCSRICIIARGLPSEEVATLLDLVSRDHM